MRSGTRDMLAHEAAQWYRDGLIGKEVHEVLACRYDARGLALTLLLRWLGLSAMGLLVCSVLAMVGVMLQSPFAGGVAVLGGGVGIGWYGRKLVLNVRESRPIVASALLSVAVACVYAALLLFHASATGMGQNSGSDAFHITALFVAAAVAVAVAYSFRLLWPLLLGLVGFIHGVGAWEFYLDKIDGVRWQDPSVMAFTALAVVVFGLFHERRLEVKALRRHVGFGNVYVVTGLCYLHFWVTGLTVWPGHWGWDIARTLLPLAEMVIGARLMDSRLKGFGVVFFCIDAFFRYFAALWRRSWAGVLLLLLGIACLALGWLFERFSKKLGEEIP